ncbi:MAG: hypothetical protein Q8P53_02335 [Candidatus Shapirobacteria bacterium]|nr:hypothetical protein [Candidatus Shapirobacteria bacterium]
MAKYSKDLLEKICELIKKGLSNRDASFCMGISESTFYEWQKEKPEFSDTIKKAEMERKLLLISRIFEASNKSWQAAAWYLERVYTDEFGKREPKDLKDETDDKLVKEQLIEINKRLARGWYKTINQ